MAVSSAEVMNVGEISIDQKIQRENKGEGRTSEMRPHAQLGSRKKRQKRSSSPEETKELLL